MSRREGFTLIELLVVIAIIGMLAAVVMASLNSARTKGADAGIQANLNNVRTQAQFFYDESGGIYGAPGTSCSQAGSVFTDPLIIRLIASSENASGQSATCANDLQRWVMSVPLRSSGAWCVNYAGIAIKGTANTTTFLCQ